MASPATQFFVGWIIVRGFIRQLDNNLERWLMLGFYAYIVAVVFIEVIRRFVLEYSSVWGEETARYAFVYLVWIGAAAAIKERSHIRIDVIFHLVPRKFIPYLYLFGEIVTLLFAFIAIYYSAESVLSSIKFQSLTSGLRINQAWFTVAVPFGFLLIIVRLLQAIVRDISDIRNGRAPYTGRAMFG